MEKGEAGRTWKGIGHKALSVTLSPDHFSHTGAEPHGTTRWLTAEHWRPKPDWSNAVRRQKETEERNATQHQQRLSKGRIESGKIKMGSKLLLERLASYPFTGSFVSTDSRIGQNLNNAIKNC